ncbi:MAG TPA: hypothetical protein VEO19_02815 [Terriglobia bacterium]|nr:hypothetical protein [Terriglobia bacterium]
MRLASWRIYESYTGPLGAGTLTDILGSHYGPGIESSGRKAIECLGQAQRCEATFRFDRPAGWYDLDVEYFDQNNGESRFRLFVGNQKVDEWIANDHLPATKPGGDSSTRRRVTGLALRPGDQIHIEGSPDGGERAPVDYVEIRAK